MFDTLPTHFDDFKIWPWDQIAPYGDNLLARDLDTATVDGWLADWTQLFNLIGETRARLQVATTTNTADEEAETALKQYTENIMPRARELEQQLKEKLLASGLEPAGFEIPLRTLRVEAEIFRAENLPLQIEIEQLGIEVRKISGEMTVEWDGEELPLAKLWTRLQNPDRDLRERAWHAGIARLMQERDRYDEAWAKFLDLRLQMAHNAGFDDYRSYRWQELGRFDYTPEDCQTFHAAIEEVVIPAVSRLNERRKAHMGVDTLRAWDIYWFGAPDPFGRPGLEPYTTLEELEEKTEAIFRQVDPALGDYFHIMRNDGLMDLESRKNKMRGGYMTMFPVAKRPFIFTTAAGVHGDVQTLLHEGGHAFHYFESAQQPYYQQYMSPMEFAEVGSMAMELLAAPYLAEEHGGFYSAADANRARAEHLEGNIRFWPYMAVVDSFQHWVYENPDAAHDPRQADAAWAACFRRFMPDYDWTGIEDHLEIYWRLQGHIMGDPFYYIEYGLAQLGAAQIWANARQDQAGAVARYREALALGNTRPLPDLFAAAGARLAFDAGTLRETVDLIMQTIEELDTDV